MPDVSGGAGARTQGPACHACEFHDGPTTGDLRGRLVWHSPPCRAGPGDSGSRPGRASGRAAAEVFLPHEAAFRDMPGGLRRADPVLTDLTSEAQVATGTEQRQRNPQARPESTLQLITPRILGTRATPTPPLPWALTRCTLLSLAPASAAASPDTELSSWLVPWAPPAGSGGGGGGVAPVGGGGTGGGGGGGGPLQESGALAADEGCPGGRRGPGTE